MTTCANFARNLREKRRGRANFARNKNIRGIELKMCPILFFTHVRFFFTRIIHLGCNSRFRSKAGPENQQQNPMHQTEIGSVTCASRLGPKHAQPNWRTEKAQCMTGAWHQLWQVFGLLGASFHQRLTIRAYATRPSPG